MLNVTSMFDRRASQVKIVTIEDQLALQTAARHLHLHLDHGHACRMVCATRVRQMIIRTCAALFCAALLLVDNSRLRFPSALSICASPLIEYCSCPLETLGSI